MNTTVICRLIPALILTVAASIAFGQAESLTDVIRAIEGKLDARIGVAVNILASDMSWEYRSDERFPLSSTFKPIACAALLHRVDAGQDNLERKVYYAEEELVTYSPVTQNRWGPAGMTLSELCEATITVSDNTAGNLILEAIGGPAAVTGFARVAGDELTRLDRWETALNEAIPGDVRDTTTPAAMAYLLETLLFGDLLTLDSRNRLKHWLQGNKVGDALLRAGIPRDWEIGDKTGAGGYGSRSVAAVMWPPNGDPVIATIYITETDSSFEERNAAIADIGRAIAKALLNYENPDCC